MHFIAVEAAEGIGDRNSWYCAVSVACGGNSPRYYAVVNEWTRPVVDKDY